MLIKLNEGEEIRYVRLINSLRVESSVDGVHARRKGECGEPVYFLFIVLEQKTHSFFHAFSVCFLLFLCLLMSRAVILTDERRFSSELQYESVKEQK